MDPKEITWEMVGKKLREIVMTRGRRGTDKQEQVEMLSYLVQVSKGPAQKLEVLAQLVSSLFDLNPTSSSYLKLNLWRKCVIHMLDIMKLLQVSSSSAEGAESLAACRDVAPAALCYTLQHYIAAS